MVSESGTSLSIYIYICIKRGQREKEIKGERKR